MVNVYYDKDADLAILKEKRIAVIGYGSQGHAHALNLKDSGMNVRIGLRSSSSSCADAASAGLKVATVVEVSDWANVVMILVPF